MSETENLPVPKRDGLFRATRALRALLTTGSFAGAVLLLVSLTFAGCANFRRLRSDVDRLGHICEVHGEVTVAGWTGAPIAVALFTQPTTEGMPERLEYFRRLSGPGDFAFLVPPGRYRIAALEDENSNFSADEGERGFRGTEIISLGPGVSYGPVRLHVSEALENIRSVAEDVDVLRRRIAAGEILPLEDPLFASAPGRMGVWQPLTWMDRYRPGLYMLGPYDPTRTPVLFVHGMSGYPQEFSDLIAGLDATRFQPWVFVYPSGFRLGTVSTVLRAAIDETRIDHSFERLCLVGHSVGGVVLRDYLNDQLAADEGDYVRGLVSIAAPFDGIPSAAKGVRMAPAVVPSWRDLVPEGDFMSELFERRLPEEVEFHLLMSFIPQEPSDGVVYISSQLRAEAQVEADVVRGYAETHGGVLRSADVVAQVNAALDRCRGDRQAGPRIGERAATRSRRQASEAEMSPALRHR